MVGALDMPLKTGRYNYALVLTCCVLLFGTTWGWSQADRTLPPAIREAESTFVSMFEKVKSALLEELRNEEERDFVERYTAEQGLCEACTATMKQYLPPEVDLLSVARRLSDIPAPFCQGFNKKKKIYRKCMNLIPTIYTYIRTERLSPETINREKSNVCKSIPHPKKKGKMACQDSMLWDGKTCKACRSILESWPDLTKTHRTQYYSKAQNLFIAGVELDQWVRKNADVLQTYVGRMSSNGFDIVEGMISGGMGLCQGLNMCAGPTEEQTHEVGVGALKVMLHLVERALKRIRDVTQKYDHGMLGKTISKIPSGDWDDIEMTFGIADVQFSSWTRKTGGKGDIWGILHTELGSAGDPDTTMSDLAVKESIATLDLRNSKRDGISMFDLAVKIITEQVQSLSDEQDVMADWKQAQTHMHEARSRVKRRNGDGLFEELKMCEAHLLRFMEGLRTATQHAIWELEYD